MSLRHILSRLKRVDRNQYRPIIICGTGRSGTSIFTKLINLHPNIYAFRWESQIFSGFPNLCEIATRSFNPNDIANFKHRILTHLFKRTVRPGAPNSYEAGLFEIIEKPNLLFFLEQMESEIVKATSRTKKLQALRNFSNNLFLAEMQRNGAKRWCEKTPRNLLYANEINEILGECQFIHIIRDGRDVISSILSNKFWPVSLKGISKEFNAKNAAHYWKKLIKIGIKNKENFENTVWLDVKLENLANNPAATWSTILQFLDLPWNDAVLDIHSNTLTRKQKGVLEWGECAHLGRWQNQLSFDDVAVIETIAGPELSILGYL